MKTFSKFEVIAASKGYKIDKAGCVTSPTGHVISQAKHRGGYLWFHFRQDGKFIRIKSHRLQAFQKFGESMYGFGMEVRHLNNNPADNSFENIAIGNHLENMSDSRVGWSRISESCLLCKSNKLPHYGKGMCNPCYQKSNRKRCSKKASEFSIVRL